MESFRQEEFYTFSKSEVGKSNIPMDEFIKCLNDSLTKPSKLGKGRLLEVVPFGKTKEECCISSWKFKEWDYIYHVNGHKHGVQLPSLARGLFTFENRIVCRGYDKFFSYDEVDITKYDNLKTRFSTDVTDGFEVTLKTNGCIILISGLDEETLLICSKHSTGYLDPTYKNHALQAENILNKQLAQHHIDPKLLAKLLFEMNVTIVCEYCDDEFEEHVLKYKDADRRGLYLHGINFNIAEFKTFPMRLVERFGERFGFLRTDWFKVDNLDKLWNFLTVECEDGMYKNEEVEGFVIRKNSKNDLQSGSPTSFFFKYKFDEPYLMYREWREATKKLIKSHINSEFFDRYNDVTRDYLKFVNKVFEERPELKLYYGKGHGIIALRCLYLESIGKNGYELTKDRYKKNVKNVKHGTSINKEDLDHKLDDIVFDLQKLNISIDHDQINRAKNQKIFYKYIIIAVATPGCGKTTFFQTLINIFPEWAMIQADNLSKNRTQKNKMELKCIQYLCGHGKHVLENGKFDFEDDNDEKLDKNKNNVIVIDKNNHMFREREFTIKQLTMLKDLYLNNNPENEFRYEFKFICANFINEKIFSNDIKHFKQNEKFYKFTTDRIIGRGENHQSIRIADESDIKLAKGIAKQFIKRFQLVNTSVSPDDSFNLVVDLNIYKNIEYNISLFINDWNNAKISHTLLKYPSESEIEESFRKALKYKPTFIKFEAESKKKDKRKENSTKQQQQQQKKKSKISFTYFGILIDHNVLLGELKQVAQIHSEFSKIYQLFVCNKFILKKFHITLIHKAHKQKQKFENVAELFTIGNKEKAGSHPTAEDKQCNFIEDEGDKNIKILKNVVFDVKLDKVVWDERCITILVEIVRSDVSIETCNKHLHITVGVAEGTKPVYSNSLLESFFKDPENIAHLPIVDSPVLPDMPLMGFV